jgi:hypothetical protein
MKKEIAKPSANGHISMVNVLWGPSENYLIVRCIVFFMECIDEAPMNQGIQKRNE